MSNKRYVKGANFERRVVNHFRKNGWFAARTAGSHSPVDVIAFLHNDVYAIQCKTGRITSKDKGEMRYFQVNNSQVLCYFAVPCGSDFELESI